MGERRIAIFVFLIFKCVFELGYKLWTESNDNITDKFIVGWRLVMSEKREYLQWKS